MSIGEHFAELRQYLLRALKGLGLLTIICLIGSRLIHDYLSEPYHEQVGKGHTVWTLVAEDIQPEIESRLPEYFRFIQPGSETTLDKIREDLEAGPPAGWFASAADDSLWNEDIHQLILDMDLLRPWFQSRQKEKPGTPALNEETGKAGQNTAGPTKKVIPEAWLDGILRRFSPTEIIWIGHFGPGERDHDFRMTQLREREFEFMLDRPLFPAHLKRALSQSFTGRTGRISGARFQHLKPTELFSVYLNIAFMVSLLFGFPWVLMQIWGFVGPAFAKPIRRAGSLAIGSSTTLFWAGVGMAWFFVFPQTLYYLVVKFNFEDTVAQFSIRDYYTFFFAFHFGFGIAFQIPILIVILGKIGIVSSQFLWRRKDFVIVGMAILSAMLTPPDVLSQLMLMAPLIILYFTATLIVRLIERKRARNYAASDWNQDTDS